MTVPRITRALACQRAGAHLAAAVARRDALTPAEAARAAHTPTGPSLAELERRIAARRSETAGERAA